MRTHRLDWRKALPALACAGCAAFVFADCRGARSAFDAEPALSPEIRWLALALRGNAVCRDTSTSRSSPSQRTAAARPAPRDRLPGSGGDLPTSTAQGTGAAPLPPDTDPGCPARMAKMGTFCVDRWEAHLVAERPGGPGGADRELVPWPHSKRPEAGVRYEARSEPNVFPQAYISRIEAAEACQNAGKRLCTMAEWSRACESKRRDAYPYGPQWEKDRCNTGKPHLLTMFFGVDAKGWKYEEHFNNALLDQQPGFLAKSGEYEGCTSDERVWDMVGNLHEWVSDTVTENLVNYLESQDVRRRKQPWRVGNGVFLGGFFSTTGEHGPGCRFVTIAHEPAYHDYSTGFRCCADARTTEASVKPHGGDATRRRAGADHGSRWTP